MKKFKYFNGNPEKEPNSFITEYTYHFTEILKKNELIKEMNKNSNKIKKVFKNELCLKNQKVQVNEYNKCFAVTINGILTVENKDKKDAFDSFLNAEIALDQLFDKIIENITK